MRVTAAAVAAALALTATACSTPAGLPAVGPSPAPPSPSAGELPAASTPPAGTPPTPAALPAWAGAALNAHLRARHGERLALAVHDHRTGRRHTYGPAGRTYTTASLVKLDIAAAVLLRAQDARRRLSATERRLTEAMVADGDNRATTALYAALGGPRALAAATARLGLTHTTPAPAWGLTRTTTADRLRLLAHLVDSDVLDADARALLRRLTGTGHREQRWGVPAAARAGQDALFKNGWLALDADAGRWAVNTIGRIRGPDTDVSIVILSRGHPSMAAGVAAVQRAATQAATQLPW